MSALLGTGAAAFGPPPAPTAPGAGRVAGARGELPPALAALMRPAGCRADSQPRPWLVRPALSSGVVAEGSCAAGAGAQVGRMLAVQEALARRLLGPAEYYRLGPPLSEDGDKARWETRSAR